MKNFIKALESHKWEFIGILFLTIGSECFKFAGYKEKERLDIWQEANKITKDTSGD